MPRVVNSDFLKILPNILARDVPHLVYHVRLHLTALLASWVCSCIMGSVLRVVLLCPSGIMGMICHLLVLLLVLLLISDSRELANAK